MTSIASNSRVRSPDMDIKNNRTISRASTAFRTTDRNTRAHWGNRFVKDFNDLTYDIKYDLIKGKTEIDKSTKFQKNNGKISGRSTSATIDNSRRKNGISSDKYQNIANLIRINKTVNPEKHVIIEEPKYSTLDSQGLCKHQFEKTIIGKMTHKSNHHMCFGYQTERLDNVNHIWYDQQKELNFNKMLKTAKKNSIDKCHDFGSYTSRKVFQPRQELDKFYNTQKQQKKTRPITIKETVKMNRVSGRKNQRPPPGAHLSYNQPKSRKITLQRPPSYQISRSKRELKFGRQVISLDRGCYR